MKPTRFLLQFNIPNVQLENLFDAWADIHHQKYNSTVSNQTVFCIEKDSIAVEGVSLTVAAFDDDGFEVALIPHTLEVTTLGRLEPGDEVNLEADVLGKVVERLVAVRLP